MSARVGPTGPLTLLGDNLSLGEDLVTVRTRCGNDLVDMTIEQALRAIDQFIDPGQTRLLQALPLHYDLSVLDRSEEAA